MQSPSDRTPARNFGARPSRDCSSERGGRRDDKGGTMRALVTRPRENASSIAKVLAERDIEVLLEPLLDIRPIEHKPIELDGIQAILVTSPAGARALADAVPRRDVPVYVVGDATADILRDNGFEKVESARGDG